MEAKANLKIQDIYKIVGLGVVLVLETISDGIVRCGFRYKYNEQTIITIKSFENNFCISEFKHPNNYILANVQIYGCSFNDLQKDMILEAK